MYVYICACKRIYINVYMLSMFVHADMCMQASGMCVDELYWCNIGSIEQILAIICACMSGPVRLSVYLAFCDV